MKKYLKIGITGAAILASGILCAFVLFKMRIIIELLKGIKIGRASCRERV